jgi:hypothetical protein
MDEFIKFHLAKIQTIKEEITIGIETFQLAFVWIL